MDRLTVAAVTTTVVPPKQGYRLCSTPSCEAVYFATDGSVIEATDLHVAPGLKSTAPEALVCYCFHYRRSDLEAELVAAGKSTIADRIAEEVQAGNCACEVRNPSGRCCLGEVRSATREIVEGTNQQGRSVP